MTTPTLASIMTASGYFTVGASAQYPVLGKFVETQTPASLDGVSTTSMIRKQWTFDTLAIATADNNIHTLRNTVMSDLAQIGAAVDVRLAGGADARTLPAPGSAGSIPGYPKVDVTFGDSYSGGRVLVIKVQAEAMIPVVQGAVSGFNLVEHDYTIEETVGPNYEVVTRRLGMVRVRPGQVARDYIDALVTDPARASAETLGSEFEAKFTQGLDASVCRYEYTQNDPATPGGSGILDAEVIDRLTEETPGRMVRSISGNARGVNASSYAAGQEVAQTPTLKLIRREISEPRVPDGRVDFRFEYIQGASAVTGAPVGSVVFAYSERISEQPGGRQISAASFHDALPTQWLGEQLPWRYIQTVTIEALNTSVAALKTCTLLGVPVGLSTDNLVAPPSFDDAPTREGTTVVSVTRVFQYPTQQTPDPARKVVTL